jgi:preprotein translocase subunit SecF
VLILASIASLATRGLNFGIEFTGGVVLEVGYPQAADLEPIRGMLEEAGYDAMVQSFGTSRDVLVRCRRGRASRCRACATECWSCCCAGGGRGRGAAAVEFVGPQVGEELAEQGGLAMLFALLMILAYVSFRFQWKFSLGAVAALVHDVIITLGIFALFQLAFDLAVLAAVLAVIGYSLNDTIVIFDRIRENFLRMRRETRSG